MTVSVQEDGKTQTHKRLRKDFLYWDKKEKERVQILGKYDCSGNQTIVMIHKSIEEEEERYLC